MSQSTAKFLRLPAVMLRVGLSKATIYRMIGHGDFPVSYRISTRAVGWLESEIDEWMELRGTDDG